ncbi:MAG: GNAT family N-acetyltransferase [Anaerolineae bacterium]|nr:GNAT family N-acetyltransferase [Anaerolineae bacterium]
MFEIRDYRQDDAPLIDALAAKAIEQHQAVYDDLPSFAEKMKHYSALSGSMEIVVATKQRDIVGAVGYVPAHAERTGVFSSATPIMRMLVLDPEKAVEGVDKALAGECIKRAQRDGCDSIALHISSIMTVALPMYRRMGFDQQDSEADDLYGAEYGIFRLSV